MGETYTELFKVRYNGERPDLLEEINQLYGVENVSTTEESYVIVDKTVDCDISYDAELTDRTQIKDRVEEIEGVSGNVISG